MKLLFDENLSPKLALMLNDIFPASLHVHDIGLSGQDAKPSGDMPAKIIVLS